MGRIRHELLINLRSFAIKNYIIFYLPTQEGIEILRVLRSARDIEKLFQDVIDSAKEISDEVIGQSLGYDGLPACRFGVRRAASLSLFFFSFAFFRQSSCKV